MAKKIKYGLRNVHYALVTETVDETSGAITSSYGDVKSWPGAVNLTLDAEGEDSPFYADDTVYAMLSSNSGYTGSLECALIPEDVQTNVLGKKKTSDGMIAESKNDTKKYIALLTEFQMDESARRVVFYRCMLSRPSITGATIESAASAQTETVNITASPRPDSDGYITAYCDKDGSKYDTFFSSVPVPSSTP